MARAERDGAHHGGGGHHRAGHKMPSERQVVRRRGGRRQQQRDQVVERQERRQEQRPREDRQTGDIGPAFGVLSNPPNQVFLILRVDDNQAEQPLPSRRATTTSTSPTTTAARDRRPLDLREFVAATALLLLRGKRWADIPARPFLMASIQSF